MVFVQVMLMSREEIKFMVAARRYREVVPPPHGPWSYII